MKWFISFLVMFFAIAVFPVSLTAKSLNQVVQEVTDAMKKSPDPNFHDAFIEVEPVIKDCERKTSQADPKRAECLKNGMLKFASEGNFLAQMQLSLILFREKNKSEALMWYKMATDNPKTPEKIKRELDRNKHELGPI